MDCGQCMAVCPNDAIKVEARPYQPAGRLPGPCCYHPCHLLRPIPRHHHPR
nr:4Fe-4S binding protein [uncultured Sphaerochaeta sp.]